MSAAVFLAKDDPSKPLSAHSRLPFSDGFFAGKKRSFLREWHASMQTAYSVYTEKVKNTPDVEQGRSSLQCGSVSLPEVVLVQLFRCLHHVDRVHSASLVSRQCYRTVYAKGTWTEALLDNIDYEKSSSARAFLSKISTSLRRLYVRKSNGGPCFNILGIFPAVLPYVTFFELRYFMGSCEEEMSGRLQYPRDFFLIDRFLPRLRCLVLKTAVHVSREDNEDPQEILINLRLLPAHIFGRLSSFSLRAQRHVKISGVEDFLDERLGLEQLRIFNYCCLWAEGEQRSLPSDLQSGKLKRLALNAFLGRNRSAGGGVHPVGEMSLLRFQPASLVFLEICRFVHRLDISTLRQLHGLEHLHIVDMLTWFDGVDYASLFEAPVNASHFPSRLRYLRMTNKEWQFSEDEIIRIAQNCPRLRALNFGFGEIHAEVVDALAQSLRELRMVQIDYLNDLVSAVDGASGPKSAFPELRFVSAAYFHADSLVFPTSVKKAVSKKLIQVLFSKRPEMIVRVDRSFISYRLENGRPTSSGECQEDARVWEALKDEEGWCCVHNVYPQKLYYPTEQDDSDSESEDTEDG